MKNFGFHGYDNVEYIGTNGKMTEIAAAMGLTSLESLERFMDTNGAIRPVPRGLNQIPGMTLIGYSEIREINYQYIVVEVAERKSALTVTNLLKCCTPKMYLPAAISFPAATRWNRIALISPISLSGFARNRKVVPAGYGLAQRHERR